MRAIGPAWARSTHALVDMAARERPPVTQKTTRGKLDMGNGRFLQLSLADSCRALLLVTFNAFENVSYARYRKEAIPCLHLQVLILRLGACRRIRLIPGTENDHDGLRFKHPMRFTVFKSSMFLT